MDKTRIVEMGGVKVEFDLRTAKQVDTYKVGDAVKVLVKDYSSYSVKYGVIVDFANFTQLPSIVVAYMDGWNGDDIKFVHINAESKDIEIAPCSKDELKVDKESILRSFDKKVADKESEIKELKEKKRVFLDRFGKIFTDAK